MDKFKSFLAALMMGMIIGMLIGKFLLRNAVSLSIEAREVIAQCEIELPRDQHCVLTAVVEE